MKTDSLDGLSERALDARARRAARSMYLAARKSRLCAGTAENRGLYALVNPMTGTFEVGERYDIPAERIIEMAREEARQEERRKLERAHSKDRRGARNSPALT